ncbi:benomyl methotrexate resistance protein [Grosmannia clavigera kw1407]|uniref:Benomyl methotrexate resistance protein n=1 Tax=Grosmannia clavigera (strain kw1407 / UAMH 11150) TaxID=655863 RepID=F0XAC0_GROCL|nr:benomyl methotrexate resistance protein [Grosmannia clavigera kw1407]EFX05503.1 benomyl methotrexate resistance protein [Grosmannia clavigera kw1407]
MADIIRDTAVGAVIRFVTRKRLLQYPEERADFELPEVWQRMLNGEDVPQKDDDTAVEEKTMQDGRPGSSTSLSSASFVKDIENRATGSDSAAEKREERAGRQSMADEEPYAALRQAPTARSGTHVVGGTALLQHSKSREETLPFTEERLETKDGRTLAIVVDWYASDDKANPQNWSRRRRYGVTLLISIYTFAVYTSSAIYTTSEEGVMASFGVDATHAALGLALFVLGYGTGPLLSSPLSEIASIGRNPVYAVTMILYVIVSLPTALAYGNRDHGHASTGTFSGLLALRFLQGFFGSPCLASRAASLGDMYSLLNLPFGLVAWVSAAFCGPALGPLLSGYSVPAKGWRWSLLEILWAAAPVCVAMLILLPETSAETILLRRTERLRRLTGSDRFQAPSEARQYATEDAAAAAAVLAGKPPPPPISRAARSRAILIDALIKPLEITLKDPAILFVQVYSAIIYGIYYSFFEAFPLVYPLRYGMTAGQVGLVFLCVLVACIVGVAIYCCYLALYLNPRIRASGKFPPPEDRLIPALIAAFGPTMGLFIVAGTANDAPHTPWIAPTIGITLYGASVFVVMQCIFVYVPLSYPQYAASLFAGNDFFRSAFAFGSILFGRPLYINLGIGRGSSLLGGLSTIGIIGIWLLYFYGARLHALSKFAVVY